MLVGHAVEFARRSLTTTLNAYDDANRKTATTLRQRPGHDRRPTTRRASCISVANGTASAPTGLGTTTYAYDAGGRLRIVTDPTGVRQFFFYDEAGRKVGQVDGDGTLTEFVYDQASQVIKTIKYAVRVEQHSRWPRCGWHRQSDGRDAATCAPRPNTSRRPTSHAQRVRRWRDAGLHIDAIGAVTQIIYDGAGRITDTDPCTQHAYGAARH